MQNLYEQEPLRPRVRCIVSSCLANDLFDSTPRNSHDSHEYIQREHSNPNAVFIKWDKNKFIPDTCRGLCLWACVYD